MPNKETTIPAGWTGFYNEENKVVGYSEFKNGGKAHTALSIVSAETEKDLLVKFKKLGLTCEVTATELKPNK